MMPNLSLFKTSATALQELLPWGKPFRENTKTGSKVVRIAKPSPAFLSLYRSDRRTFEMMGVSMRRGKFGQKIVEWRRDPLLENEERKEWEKNSKKFIRENIRGIKVDSAGLLKSQVAAVQRNVYSLKKYGYAHEGSDTGVGKTYIAFAVARHIGKRMLVVAPKVSLPSWKQVGEHFQMVDKMLTFKRGKSKIEYAVNVEKLKMGDSGYGHWELKDGDHEWVWTVPDDVLIVLDELHMYKGIYSSNAKVFMAAKAQGIPLMGMSATAANDPTHMRGLGKILGMHDGTEADFYQWCKSYGCTSTYGGALKFYGGLHVLAKLHAKIYPEHGNRIRSADMPDFPETLIKAQTYDMGANRKHINQAYIELNRELALIEAKEKKAKNRLVVMLRARQKIEMLKVPAFVELAKNAIQEGNSVAIFVNFKATLYALMRQLKTDCIIKGGQPATVRQRNIERFQDNSSNILLCNIAAGGISISLHDLYGGHPRYSVISPGWSSFHLVQALGRVHRAGGKTKSVQKIVFAAGTIEEKVCANVNRKLTCLNTLNDGDMNAGIALFA